MYMLKLILNLLKMLRGYMKIFKKYYKSGFTLAEVLVTLGIIGVVAALTIPILINKHQNAVALAGIKVAYAKINDGFLFMRSDENVDDLTNLSVFKNMNQDNFTDPDIQANLDSQMKKYFSILKSYKAGESCAECPIYVQMNGSLADGGQYDYAWRGFSADGMIYYMHLNGPQVATNPGKIKSLLAYFFVDINGTKGPNKWGKDMFQYALAQNGILYSAWGKDLSDAMPLSQTYWGRDASGCGSPENKDVSSSTGYACTARIIEKSWHIDYD